MAQLKEIDEITETQVFIPKFELDSVKVIKVHDGDTYTVAGFINTIPRSVYRFSVRLRGIDCPEIKGDDHEFACKVRDIVSEMILNKVVLIKNIAKDKYGRLLADIYTENFNLSKWLIEQGYGYEYYGKKKK